MFCALKPSYNIPQTVITQSPIAITESIKAGDPIVIQWPHAIQTLNIQNQKLTKVLNKAFGVVNLYSAERSFIAGEFGAIPGHAFRFPKQKLFIQTIAVDKPNQQPPVPIRLPAEVSDKIEQRGEHEINVEQNFLRKLLLKSKGELDSTCWQRPLGSKIVSEFASNRTLPSGKQYYHTGLDLRAWTGRKIHSSSSGTVVFSEFLTLQGNMVIIDHGAGIMSRYMHLDKLLVKEGETVTKGQLIGLSGATGRVEAPHLHWEIVWKGIPANPENFLAAMAPLCDQA